MRAHAAAHASTGCAVDRRVTRPGAVGLHREREVAVTVMTLRWSEDCVADVADVAELERVLNRVREELGSGSAAPRFVELHNPPHGFMHLGIGAPYTVLSYMAEHEAGPYYVSRGEPGRLADVPEIVAFDYGG